MRKNVCGLVLGGRPDIAFSDPRVLTALETGTGECSIRFTGKCQVRHQWAPAPGASGGRGRKGNVPARGALLHPPQALCRVVPKTGKGRILQSPPCSWGRREGTVTRHCPQYPLRVLGIQEVTHSFS